MPINLCGPSMRVAPLPFLGVSSKEHPYRRLTLTLLYNDDRYTVHSIMFSTTTRIGISLQFSCRMLQQFSSDVRHSHTLRNNRTVIQKVIKMLSITQFTLVYFLQKHIYLIINLFTLQFFSHSFLSFFHFLFVVFTFFF